MTQAISRLALLLLLIASRSSFGLQSLEARDGETLLAKISRKEVTRIAVEHEHIRKVTGNAGEFVLEKDDDSGQIFIRPASPESTNPFSLVEDIDEDMELLQPLLAQMVSPREPLDAFRYSTLGAAIKTVWKRKGREMTVSDVHALLATGRLDDEVSQEEGDRRLKDLAAMLHPYTREGVYGKYFEASGSIDFSADFIVLELEELKSKKDLQTVVLLIVMYRITREMYFSRDRKKIVIIDEAWDLLSGGATAEFIEAGYRRARKYKGAFMSATQGVDDYYRNPAAKAALDNSDWVFLLRQKPESIEMLDKLGQLTMDDAMKRLLQSLRTEHGAYSEIFIHSPAGNGIGRLIVDPWSLLLFSTRAEDFSAINAERARGLSVPEAIDAVLAARGLA